MKQNNFKLEKRLLIILGFVWFYFLGAIAYSLELTSIYNEHIKNRLPSVLSATTSPRTFSGNIASDFTGSDVIVITDGVDSTLVQDDGSSVSSGWDIAAVYLDYDVETDTLFAAYDCYFICGDADNDGDPSISSNSTYGGTDNADLGGTESFSLLFDTNVDGTYDVVVGTSGISDMTGWGAYAFTGTTALPAFGYGSALSSTSSYLFNPSSAVPDLFFRIDDFSQLPGFTHQIGDNFTFNVFGFAGSLEDGNIGEDYAPGQNSNVEITFPEVVSVGDYVWYDDNQDGVQDSGELPAENVTVELLDASGKLLKTDVTDASGNYLFEGLDAATYCVRFTLPSGYSFTASNVNSTTDLLDSDADQATGETMCINVPGGTQDLSFDAGLFAIVAAVSDAPEEVVEPEEEEELQLPATGFNITGLYATTALILMVVAIMVIKRNNQRMAVSGLANSRATRKRKQAPSKSKVSKTKPKTARARKAKKS